MTTELILTTPSDLDRIISAAVDKAMRKVMRPKMMTKVQVAEAIQRSTKTVDRMVAAHQFPAPVDGRWATDVVDRWIADRAL
jgi:predicted DNA-binding transcriptional regulator AlpA